MIISLLRIRFRVCFYFFPFFLLFVAFAFLSSFFAAFLFPPASNVKPTTTSTPINAFASPLSVPVVVFFGVGGASLF